MKCSTALLLFTIVFALKAAGQKTKHYNLQKLLKQGEIVTFDSLQTKPLQAKKGAISSKGNIWFKNILFNTGTIDVDLRGKDVFLNSFLGINFHGTDTTHYDVLYFRPFNFKHTDTARRHWSLQYMSLPQYNYAVLRASHPLQYESTVTPVPDPNDWFHATVIITGDSLEVYVNHSATASLKVHLLNAKHDGLFGLYSDGLSADFANLDIKQ
ncbi:MAG TPA: family 16 glycoside hydrolase [Chitinophagaceae bacterium]|jgi:hypothetical protein|nr:family 16 glycoside hydrolase [Chitinophagaceae bacterium]